MSFISPDVISVISAIENSKSIEQLNGVYVEDLCYRFDSRLVVRLSQYSPCLVAIDGFDLFNSATEDEVKALRAAVEGAVSKRRAELLESLLSSQGA